MSLMGPPMPSNLRFCFTMPASSTVKGSRWRLRMARGTMMKSKERKKMEQKARKKILKTQLITWMRLINRRCSCSINSSKGVAVPPLV